MKTTIINDTTHVLRIREDEPNAGIYTMRATLVAGGTHKTYCNCDPNATYDAEFIITDIAQEVFRFIFRDELWDFATITLYVTPVGSVAWHGAMHDKRKLKKRAPYKLLESAAAIIKTVASLCASLEIHLKKIKICHAQCEHLVQSLSKGIQKIVKIYTNVSQDVMVVWNLYRSRKLRNLVSSLYSLVMSLRSTKNLLFKCGSDWKKMALVVSIPPLPGMKTCSEFDLLMGELRWKLAMIEYLLNSGKESDVQWKWCTRACRFELLVTNKETDGGEAEDDTCARVNSDRDNLIRRLKDGSIFAHELNWLWPFKFSFQFARAGVGEVFGTVLKQRLTVETFVSSSLNVERFEINHLYLKCIDKLSSGAAKKVYRGEWLGQKVAIAIMGSRSNESLDLNNLVKKEAGFLLKLQHPNIVVCYGYSYIHNAPWPASKPEGKPAGYLVLELMEEDLGRAMEKHMNSIGPFKIHVGLDILLQIVEAMVHLHKHNIMHRDLKPGNCLVKPRSIPSSNPQLLDVYYDVKLTDFGSARNVDPGDAKSTKTANPGTRLWMAPEMVCPPGNWSAEYGKSADVFSFGIICYQVITGIVPYADELINKNPSDVFQEVSENKLRPTFPPSLSCPEGLKQLMRDCWDHEADSRPNFKEIQRRLWSIRKDDELADIILY